MTGRHITRKTLLKATAAAASALSTAPASALGANDRINMGCIGVGAQGGGHLNSLVNRSKDDNIRVLAVSDVYQRRLNHARERCGGDAYLDYRKLLERKDIDAVLIATPDHWHAKISMDAIEAGKHVYVEKPMTHTVEQALALRDCVRKHKLVLQVGPNATADDGIWQAQKAIKQRRIGKVTFAEGSYNRNCRICLFDWNNPVDPTAAPDAAGEDFVDWNMWLGHEFGLAPKIPWTPDHYFRFRKYWAYSGGVATDLLYHKLAPLLLAIAGPNGQYPLHVTAGGGLYLERDGRQIPDVFMMTVDYPGDFSVVLVSILTNDTQFADRIHGKFGTLDLEGDPVLRANGDFFPEFQGKNGGEPKVTLAREPRRDLEGNFLDAIRGKGPVHCNVELGCSTMVAIKMAVDSYRLRKSLAWDSKSERVVG
jgi:predicted dehydrogenase